MLVECRHAAPYILFVFFDRLSPHRDRTAALTAKTGSPSLLGGKANDGQRAAPLRLATMRLLAPGFPLWAACKAATRSESCVLVCVIY